MKKIILFTLLTITGFYTNESNAREDLVALNEQTLVPTKAAFVGLTAFDKLTAQDGMICYGPVDINGATLPANTLALAVYGETVASTLMIGEIQNVYGTSPTGPIQDVIVNANGMLGSTAHAGGGGTVTSVTGGSNIIVTNPTTTPVISLSPNMHVTAITASGAVGANSVSATSATINNSLTANTITATNLASSAGKIVTVGSGGSLSTATLAGADGIVITQNPGNITIAQTSPMFRGDSGTASPSNSVITFTAAIPSDTIQFVGSGSTVSLQITDSNNNTILGTETTHTGSQIVAISAQASADASGDIALGYHSNAFSQNSITIGSYATPAITTAAIALGDGAIGSFLTLPAIDFCYIGGIFGVAGTGNTASININAPTNLYPQLYAPSSSRNYKENITPLPTITDIFMQLRPVSFSYIKDETHTTHLGFIAEEVEPLFPEMIIYDKDGKIESLCAQFFNPIIIKMAQEQEQAIHAFTERKKQLVTDLQELKKLLATILVNNKK